MIALVLALLTFVVTAAGAENIVCDNVSPGLRAFGLVTDTLVTKLGSSGYPLEPWGTSIYRRACTRRGKMAATVIQPLFVATESAAAAMRFTHGTIAGSTCWNQVEGDLVTGGGAVTGIDPECIDGSVDTTGTHAAVADCNQAFIDRQTASDFFASRPVDRELGSITIAPFDNYTLALAPNEVVHIDSLTVKGGYDPDFKLLCYDYTNLDITGGPAVVNLDRLEIGPCVLVHTFGAAVLLNLPGSGHTIKIGRGAIVPPPILAPARTVTVRGTLDDGVTFIGSTFARRLKMTGLSSLEHPFPSCP
jgi:hypothetical protein